MPPLVSIIIPAFNSEDTIARCISAAARQIIPDGGFEVIVVDNGSTDGTLDIIREHDVTCVVEERRGRSAARNRGSREARGRFLAFLDSDCVPPDSWVANALRVLDRPWIGAVQARIRKHGHAPPPRAFVQGYYYAPFLDTAGLVVQRSAFDQTLGFDEELPRNVDIDFTFRLLASGYALGWDPDTIVVKYHYLDSRQAWRRGLEGGRAGSQLEAKWQRLVGHKSRGRRYRDRIRGAITATVRGGLDPQPGLLRVTATEQIARLAAYSYAEAFGAGVTRRDYSPVTPLPSVLGPRRFLVLAGQEGVIFDAEHERAEHLDVARTVALKAKIDAVSRG